MGYHLKILTVPGHESPAAFQPVEPKTHTPLSPLQDRGLRFYNSETGRWMSRDPIGEFGGINTYCSMNNNAINKVDLHGNAIWEFTENLLPWIPAYGVVPGSSLTQSGVTWPDKVTVRMDVKYTPGQSLPWSIETTQGKLIIDFTAKDATAESHERQHVADYRQFIFNDTKTYVTGWEAAKWRCYEPAACHKNVCENIAPIVYQACGEAYSIINVDLPYAIQIQNPLVWNAYMQRLRVKRQECVAGRASLVAAENTCRNL